MDKNQIQTLALKISQVITFLVGIAFTTYNLFAFRVVKNGYYYQDGTQTWLAFGVCSLAVYYLIRNWKKM